MALRTETEIRTDMKANTQTVAPQERVDSAKGVFFDTSIRAVSGVLAQDSADVERLAKLSTNQFPKDATTPEVLGFARSFGEVVGQGGQATVTVFFCTGRRPTGTQSFGVTQGAAVSTSQTRGLVFGAIETRALTASNADAFYNSRTRRFEMPVLCRCLSAGTQGNVAPQTIRFLLSGAPDFDTVVNPTEGQGGTDTVGADSVYARVQTTFAGLDTFSRGGLLSTALNAAPDFVTAGALTYSTEYPNLFYRLPDGPSVDVWIDNSASPLTKALSFVATAGQTRFDLAGGPVLSLLACTVSGVTASATLTEDDNPALGRSTRETSYVTLGTPCSGGEVVVVQYTIDAVPNTIQAALDGYNDPVAGALFDADVLVRYRRELAVVISVTGSVLGNFDPTSVESEVVEACGTYMGQGLDSAPVLGGVRSAGELRDFLRTTVPGINTLNIPVFCREQFGTFVEVIDIPRNAVVSLTSVTATFT